MYPKQIKKRYSYGDIVAESFYSKQRRELLVDDGELSNEEDGFMKGYNENPFLSEFFPEDCV